MKPSLFHVVILLGPLFPHAAPAQDVQKPGPEHDRLKAFVGTWKTKTEIFIDGKGDPIVSTGVETAKLGCGGRWLIFDLVGDDKKANFAGHGTMGWDAVKKTYTGTWVDSMSPAIQISEGPVDATGKVFTMEGNFAVPGVDGVFRQKSVSEIKDASSKVYTMYRFDKEGKEFLFGRVTYTRQR